MTKIFFDTEFVEDGKTVDLLSIGLVAEDGRELYIVNEDEDVITRAVQHPWLSANVVPSLPIKLLTNPARLYGWDWDTDHDDWPKVMKREEAADKVKQFILSFPDPELWAWYAAYDHVALCQLFGRMIDLPQGIPMWTNDLKQEAVRLGNPTMPEQAVGVHNALADARHNKVMAEYLQLSYPIRYVTGLDEDLRHIIEFRQDSWTIMHPLSCRPNLFNCPVNKAAERDLTNPPTTLGRFECSVNNLAGRLLIGDRA